MLTVACKLQGGISLSKTELMTVIPAMQPGDVLMLHINAQNAGLIMRHGDTEMIYEMFEVSPRAADVMGAKGRLLCSYPGPVIALPLSRARDPLFLEELCRLLEQLDRDMMEKGMPKSWKAGNEVIEQRDTADPMFITQMLTGILRSLGRVADVPRICKRIADDVLWDCAELPWRRSPLWLVLRVTLQTTLERDKPEELVFNPYKAFMVFLLARMLGIALRHDDFDSNMLHIMNAKLARRVYKMEENIPDFVSQYAGQIVKETRDSLDRRWKDIRAKDSASHSSIWNPQQLDFQKDAELALDNSSSYLTEILQSQGIAENLREFAPNHPHRIKHSEQPSEPPEIPSRPHELETFLALADFEEWVDCSLEHWLGIQLASGEAAGHLAMQALSDRINAYTSKAKSIYADNPVEMSVMFLTTLSLWVALDELAVRLCYMLGEYSPEIPVNLMEPLLLPKKRQMERLHQMEQYLCQRHQIAKSHDNPSIFGDSVGSTSFSVRYFERSEELSRLRVRIEQGGKIQKQQRITVLNVKKRQHAQLLATHRELNCEYVINWKGHSVHDNRCRKCRAKDEADGIRIEVFEWPLPENGHKCMNVVFELSPPREFSLWRDTTFKLLHDVFGDNPNSIPEKGEAIESYRGLSEYAVRGHHITIASTTKPWSRTHYASGQVSVTAKVTQASICLNHAMNWKLFDREHSIWASECFTRFKSYISSTYHTSNQVLAEQAECPNALLLHEFIAFGSLRAGHRLQWLNIARELGARTLSFKEPAVNILLTQAAWHSGPSDPSNFCRESHEHLENVRFGRTLLIVLREVLDSVRDNWLEICTARTVTDLATRLLSLATDSSVILNTYDLIRDAREIALTWTREVVNRLQSNMSEDEKEMKKLQTRALETAALCRTTYDVDGDHLSALLRSDDDVATLLECAIVVCDNTPAGGHGVSEDLQLVLDRDRRLSRFLEPQLATLISQNRRGADLSVGRMWSSYELGTQWQQLAGPNDRWFCTTTRESIGHAAQAIQLNIIDGRLLIDGQPLGRLPMDFVSHETYGRIFGSKQLDVNPASMAGMTFETRGFISDFKVFFALRKNELVIRTRRKTNDIIEILELVPHKQFNSDLPTAYVEEYTHWMDIQTGEIELRPLNTRWQPAKANWRISFSPTGPSYMSRASTRLIEMNSPSSAMISGALQALEPRRRIHILINAVERQVSVHLPRLRLEFLINNEQELESRQFREMILDSNQDLGTLYGLRNRLVLKHYSPHVNVRMVIIPYGIVRFDPLDGHIKVTIDPDNQSRVRFYQYYLDLTLRRLVGSSDHSSIYYKAYMHAVTANCLSDPLTQKTGTEEARDVLRSAEALSFQRLGREAWNTLELIANLSPRRTFYPEGLQVMQQVEWSRLPSLMQNDWFQKDVSLIVDHYQRMSVFQQDDMVVLPPWKPRNTRLHLPLVDRALIQNSFLRSEDYGGRLAGRNGDTIYTEARDLPPFSKETNVFQVARLVREWPSGLDIHPELMDVLKGWRNIAGPDHDFSLHYDRKWLELSKKGLASHWLSLFEWCTRCNVTQNFYQLLFVLSSIAQATTDGIDERLLQTLLAFATMTDFQRLRPPRYESYDLSYEFQCNSYDISEIFEKQCALSFSHSSEYRVWYGTQERNDADRVRAENTWKTRLASQIQKLTKHIVAQWPSENFAMPPSTDMTYNLLNLTKGEALGQIGGLFKHWYRNLKLQYHLSHVQAILNSSRGAHLRPMDNMNFHPCRNPPVLKQSSILMQDLLRGSAPDRGNLHFYHRLEPMQSMTEIGPSRDAIMNLRTLLESFPASQSDFRYKYRGNLLDSCKALDNGSSGYTIKPQTIHFHNDILTTLVKHRDKCRNLAEDLFKALHIALMPTPDTHAKQVMYLADLWPRVTSRTLLHLLATNASIQLTSDWQRAIMIYGRAVTYHQQAERLIGYALRKEAAELLKEVSNKGEQGWEASKRPDWLLIELENNFLVREVQADIGREMIDPPSDCNLVTQLNMGEGKSSVIVPIVAAALADGTRLVRVVVLKPLSAQMFKILAQRLGGLVSRRIFYLPLSRSSELTADSVQQIQDIYEECKAVRGILLAQPEHILSFKLMGLERLVGDSNKHPFSEELLESQCWLDANARDILDESDEILDVRYQLIYTIGNQRPVEAHPERWTVIQELFDLVSERVPLLHASFPDAVETSVQGPKGSFPHVRILQSDAGKALMKQIVSDICRGRLSAISIRSFPEDMKQLAAKFIGDKNIEKDHYNRFAHYCTESGASLALMLLLRGLLGHNFILFTLKERRWRVDYGLDKKRTMLAVPYRAKDIPAVRAEFGHPDVAIALTCLSYYYLGLTETQLNDCFTRLFCSDNPAVMYSQWIRHCSVPDTLRHVSGVNLDDMDQFSRYIQPLFQKNKAVIDFYLSCFVFPKEAKEFPYKLSTSGWDLAKTKTHPTTGFSGTNDNRYLLPLSMYQRDLPALQETNAKVLSYILQSENDSYILAADTNGERLSTEALLDTIVDIKPPVHVLLDVGAQVLELCNQEVAKRWLAKTPDPNIQAAVYFNGKDEPMVTERDGSEEHLSVSPFSTQMEACLVYLDEVHTRGTDLKLPTSTRGAATLGPKLNKDRLVQACMRLRKLGHGQSVVFIAPPEVDKIIREVVPKTSPSRIEASHVLLWTLEETCRAMRINVSHWASQGLSYESRQYNWSQYSLGHIDLEGLKNELLEPEAQTLGQLYGLDHSGCSTVIAPQVREHCSHIRLIEEKFGEFDVQLESALREVRVQEEQERELAHEDEREQQVERPPKLEPLKHILHVDVTDFIKLGTIVPGSTAFLPAFDSLLSVSQISPDDVTTAWTRELLVTKDFAQTIKNGIYVKTDDFLRPVRWILSSTAAAVLVIMSPYEVNELLTQIRKSLFVNLHLYTPRVTESMQSFEDMTFYCIPPLPNHWRAPDRSIVQQLNLFSGQLYLQDTSAYQELCSFLSLYVDGETSSVADGALIQNDGFIKPEYRRRVQNTGDSPFTSSPVPFLQTLLGLRQKGQSYQLTHMGKILLFKLLTDDDFQLPVPAQDCL